MKKRVKIILILGMLSVIFLIGLFISWIEYSNYQDKMAIIHAVFSGEKIGSEGIDIASLLLKLGTAGMDTDAMLDSYGYGRSYDDFYRKLMYRNILKIICGLVFVFFAYLVTLFNIERWFYKKNQDEIEEIRKMINLLRKNEFPKSGFAYEDNIIDSLRSDFESLAYYLEILKEQSKTDKESTKSLVTDISHQIKTPLAALKTNLEAWDFNSTKDEQEEFAGRCRLQLTRIEGLVNALVQISRLETGIVEIKKQELSIFDTIVTAVNQIYPHALAKEIEISLVAADELKSLLIPHDTKWLAEAIINILENAVKYSPEHSKNGLKPDIVLRMSKREVFLRIEIEDKGIGIPVEERSKVFKRFYRGSSDVVIGQNGSGVGLYLTREILLRHQGFITIQTPVDQVGSLFVIQIPYN